MQTQNPGRVRVDCISHQAGHTGAGGKIMVAYYMIQRDSVESGKDLPGTPGIQTVAQSGGDGNL